MRARAPETWRRAKWTAIIGATIVIAIWVLVAWFMIAALMALLA